MSDDLTIEVCPETGIGAVVRPDASKVDLMPFEVEAIKAAGGDAETIRDVIADNDSAFASSLTDAELSQIGKTIR